MRMLGIVLALCEVSAGLLAGAYVADQFGLIAGIAAGVSAAVCVVCALFAAWSALERSAALRRFGIALVCGCAIIWGGIELHHAYQVGDRHGNLVASQALFLIAATPALVCVTMVVHMAAAEFA